MSDNVEPQPLATLRASTACTGITLTFTYNHTLPYTFQRRKLINWVFCISHFSFTIYYSQFPSRSSVFFCLFVFHHLLSPYVFHNFCIYLFASFFSFFVLYLLLTLFLPFVHRHLLFSLLVHLLFFVVLYLGLLILLLLRLNSCPAESTSQQLELSPQSLSLSLTLC
jgi:hypothetical protein